MKNIQTILNNFFNKEEDLEQYEETDFDNYLEKTHFFDYRTYCEIELLSKKDDETFCYKCKKYKEPLTYIIQDFHYLPCKYCYSSKKKSEKNNLVQLVIKNIKDFHDKLLGDRYLQLFIIDRVYFESTLPHDYSVFKNVLNMLKPPSRNDIWFLDWKLGYPKIINEQNLEGLRIINLSKYYKIESNKTNIIINNYEILLPDFIPYDVSHHCRYSLLNKTSNRKTKRIRIADSDTCIKFYNNDNNFKSIFRVVDSKTKEVIDLNKLSYRDLTVIKLVLLRNKTFVKYIYEVLYEFFKTGKNFRDGVFLKNLITLDPNRDISLNLVWFPNKEEEINNYINVSIL